MTSILAGPVTRGRHRFGRLGLVPVTFFVVVARRGLLQSWRQPGRHRPYVARRVANMSPAPAPAI
ncbi:MAG: hypothetical protein M3Y35_06665 [Actinomycetota bacterium]|nr:hypothetical protein [Actinomycetota bacterium]